MKRLVLLVMFLTVQGIIGFPQFRLNPCIDSFDCLEEKIPDLKTDIKLSFHNGFPKFKNIDIPFFVNTNLDDKNGKSISTLSPLRTTHQLNNILDSLHEFAEAVKIWITKNFITKNQSTPVNITSSNKTQVQVNSTSDDEYTISLVDNYQFTTVKTEELKDKEKKEKLEDNKEKLEDNKNSVTSESTVSSNVLPEDKTQAQVTSSAPDEHTTLVNDHQFTSVKTLKTEERKDNKEEKEKLEDNKEKLEDNKNSVTSESTVSSNVLPEDKTQAQVTSSAPDEHTTLVNDHQFTSVKTLKTEERKDNKEEKEKLEDNKEKLEDNKNSVTSESTVSSNVLPEDKTQAQVTSSAPDEHTTLVNDHQFRSVKTLKTEERKDNKEEKEKLEDNKEKLEDNKNSVTSESTVSSNVQKENEKKRLTSYSVLFPKKYIFFKDNEDYEENYEDYEEDWRERFGGILKNTFGRHRQRVPDSE